MKPRRRRLGDPQRGPGVHEESSPITKIDQIRRPLLIAQGANDPRVTRKESDSVVDALQAKKIPVTYVVYEDEGHGFARPENRMSFYAISETFLTGCLGGRAEPLGTFAGAKIAVPAGAEHISGLAAALK